MHKDIQYDIKIITKIIKEVLEKMKKQRLQLTHSVYKFDKKHII